MAASFFIRGLTNPESGVAIVTSSATTPGQSGPELAVTPGMPFASAVCVLFAARIVLFLVPLSGAMACRSSAPFDTVQQINRCLTAVRVAVSRRESKEPSMCCTHRSHEKSL
jgi:hypothetical protein